MTGRSLLSAILLISPGALAADELSMQEMLSIAKIAGACGIPDSMIQMQSTTKMPGGDEFVTRFWHVEAARLGLSVEDLSDRCNRAVEGYDRLWEAAEAMESE